MCSVSHGLLKTPPIGTEVKHTDISRRQAFFTSFGITSFPPFIFFTRAFKVIVQVC